MAGQRGIIAAVEAAVQLVVRIARLGIEGAGAALVGVAAGVRSDLAVVAAALAEPKIAKMAEGMELVKSIVVKGKLVSLIFKPKA